MLNIAGSLLAGGGIVWQLLGPMGRAEPDGISINFGFSARPPPSREARRIVARALSEDRSADWFRVRNGSWQLDLAKLRGRFELPLDWLDGVVLVEPEYDVLPDTFHPEKMRGMLRLVVERETLAAAPEIPWDEYPDDELAELVPLLARRAFSRDIERLHGRGDKCSALAMIDLDHFKQVNDRFGHPGGDAVLVRVAEIVRHIVGRRGRAYRYGGEELAVLLPDFTSDEAVPLMDRIRSTVAAERWTAYAELSVTISVGIAEVNRASPPSTAVDTADKALYRAKHGGRNRVERA